MKRVLALLCLLVACVPALAQSPGFPQVMPPNTVYGRSGISTGPGQAIPFSSIIQTLTNQPNTWTALQTFSGGIVVPTLTTCTPAASVGFVNDGVTDNLAAWNAWVAGIGSNSACLQFKPGTAYKFTGQAAATLSASQTIQLVGSGQDATEIWFSAGNGFNITMNTGTPIGFINSSSITIADMAVTTSQAGGVNGITINGATSNGYIPRQTNISRVALRGHTTTAWWATNIALTDLSDVFISQVGIYGLNNTNTNGTGISYVGTGAGTTPTLINVNDLTGFFLNVGISASGSWQGLNASKINLVDVTTGVSCTATSLQPECNVFGSQFNTARHGIVYSNIQTSSIIGNLFYQGTYTGLVNGDAIIQQTTGSGNVISNNIFSAFTLGGATPNCIDIAGGGSPVNTSSIVGNTFAGCTTNIVAGTSTNTMAAANINASGTPFTGGGSFFAYMGTSIVAFPGATATFGGGVVASGSVIGAVVAASGDTGGVAAETTLSNAGSTTISTGTGTVKMSSTNSANSAVWLKVYFGTTAYWIPGWTTNAP